MPLIPLFAYFELVLPSRKLVGLKYLTGRGGGGEGKNDLTFGRLLAKRLKSRSRDRRETIFILFSKISRRKT